MVLIFFRFFIRDMSLTAFTVIFSFISPLLAYLAPKVLRERRYKYVAVVLILYCFGLLFYMGTIQFSDILKKPNQNPIDDTNGIFDPHYYNSTWAPISSLVIDSNIEPSEESDVAPVTYRGFCFSYIEETLIEVIGVFLLSVSFISLRMLNKSDVTITLAPAFSCYGMCLATFLLFLYDIGEENKFASYWTEIIVMMFVSWYILTLLHESKIKIY